MLEATVTPSSTPTAIATTAPIATSTPAPLVGYEDWQVINPQAVTIGLDNGALVLTLKRRALWFMGEQGVLFYKTVTGNFKITTHVLATRASAPTQRFAGNTVQLGGLMLRNGKSGLENYAFIVVGQDADGLSVETKNTTDSVSEWAGPRWSNSDAELRVCRFGATINLYKRHFGAGEAWTLAASYPRPDFPETLQVGVNIYTDGPPDIQVRYDDLQLKPIVDEGSCIND
jgi:hypothetical protein